MTDDNLDDFLVTYIELPDGETHFYFDCKAEDGDHAREQCRDANPNCIIIEVEWRPY
jgi:hypothetical protein